jgi:site-specific DNA-methyltransferase (adenine-specific)
MITDSGHPNVTLYHEDCFTALDAMEENSVDSVVTDPPYALESIVKRFKGKNKAPKSNGPTGVYKRRARGFLGHEWDTGEVAFDPEFWKKVMRVLKPGGHVLAFSGTRTYHKLATAIETAGFEIRDQIQWLYGKGMPASHNVGKALDKIGVEADDWDGWGTALKPANEPICLARKPLSEKSVGRNMMKWGTGALNIEACMVPAEKKPRWPANVIHDGSEEVIAAFPESKGQQGSIKASNDYKKTKTVYGGYAKNEAFEARKDGGSAARFFYSAKATAKDRVGSEHPTVKPVSLLRYLCKLVTQPGGVVLDPFAGTGTTAQAAVELGMRAIICEREETYVTDIKRRMEKVEVCRFQMEPLPPWAKTMTLKCDVSKLPPMTEKEFEIACGLFQISPEMILAEINAEIVKDIVDKSKQKSDTEDIDSFLE